MATITPVEFVTLQGRRFYDHDDRPPHRCKVCRCQLAQHWHATPIVREDERTGIGVPIDLIRTCDSWYCREHAKHLAEIYPEIELAPRTMMPRCEGVVVYYPASAKYLKSI